MNTFDPETHSYMMEGIAVPSVTELLPKQKYYCSQAQLEIYQREGEEQHNLIKMFTDTGMAGSNKMLLAFEEWREKYREEFGELLWYEKPLFSEKFRFAGTPDYLFEKAILEIKRSRPKDKRRIALQPAGYNILAEERRIMERVDKWIVAWYEVDKNRFNSTNIWNEDAEKIFKELIKKYYIEKRLAIYLKKMDFINGTEEE